MTKDEYVTTFYVNGKKADVGIDDYGQCYFLEWEENGEKKEASLGTYNTEIVEGVFYCLDPVYRHLRNRMYNYDLADSEVEMLITYSKMFENLYKDGF